MYFSRWIVILTMPNPIRPWPARPVETWQNAVFVRASDKRNGYLTAILAVAEKEKNNNKLWRTSMGERHIARLSS
jgi:hypothetical protein